MTFTEMEATQWYEIYKERIKQDEQHMKSDFQLLATIVKDAVAQVWAKLSQLQNRPQPPQPTFRMGGSIS